MITNKERALLRKIASNTKSIFRIGKEGLTENLIDQIGKYLDAHEIIKITALESADESEKELSIKIANQLNAEVVETRGSTIVLYKKSINKKGKGIIC